jgi:signal transduction histidine kinase
VLATMTDVSEQRKFEQARFAHAQERELIARKQAEEAETRRNEADERRRGQELLIDVTSHELRQPVSAILNCSSLVRTNLARLYEKLADGRTLEPSEDALRLIADDLDALDAIYQCGLAQERIANDVLSLSRIQLEVLSIDPVDFNLVAEMKRIVSIFHNEVKMCAAAFSCSCRRGGLTGEQETNQPRHAHRGLDP